MYNLDFRFEPMPLLGVTVKDLDKEVARYEELFGIKFHIFVTGVDYEVTYADGYSGDTSPAPRNHLRLAVDTSDAFELVEMPSVPEGVRNIHYRVDEIEKATEHFVAHGLKLVQVIQAGTAKEVIFDATSLNGVRLCLMQFDGDSFAEAMLVSPKPKEK